jgi:hypothetical protein
MSEHNDRLNELTAIIEAQEMEFQRQAQLHHQLTIRLNNLIRSMKGAEYDSSKCQDSGQ